MQAAVTYCLLEAVQFNSCITCVMWVEKEDVQCQKSLASTKHDLGEQLCTVFKFLGP